MPKRLVFEIPEADPHAISMTRLLEYLAEIATILGSRESVHFLKVEEGSLPCVMEVDSEEEPFIISRVKNIANGEGTQEALQARSKVWAFLEEDGYSGRIKAESGEPILDFPLISQKTEKEFGPFSQDGTLDGILMKIGGLDQTIPVHLVYEGSHYVCNATVEMARRLGHHLLQKPIRVHGKGKWFRNADGKWELRWFDILDFEELDEASLPEVVSQLRQIPDNELMTLTDPLEEMRKIRHGE